MLLALGLLLGVGVAGSSGSKVEGGHASILARRGNADSARSATPRRRRGRWVERVGCRVRSCVDTGTLG